MTTKQVSDRLRAEYTEMPGMQLTAPQVQRLCGIGAEACRTVLAQLVDADFLYRRPDGTYARLTDSVGRPAKADLRARSPLANAS